MGTDVLQADGSVINEKFPTRACLPTMKAWGMINHQSSRGVKPLASSQAPFMAMDTIPSMPRNGMDVLLPSLLTSSPRTLTMISIPTAKYIALVHSERGSPLHTFGETGIITDEAGSQAIDTYLDKMCVRTVSEDTKMSLARLVEFFLS